MARSTNRRAGEPDRALLAAALRSSADAVVISDADARVQKINPAAEALFGVSAEEVFGGDAVELFVAPEDREMVRDWATRLQAGEQLGTGLVARLCRADGGTFSADLTMSPVLADDGHVLGIIGSARDITARLQAEADAATLRAVVDAAAEAIIGIDEHGTIRFFSPAAERIFGWPAAEIIGRDARELVAPQRRHRVGELLTLVTNGQSLRRETIAVTRAGTQFEVELSARPIVASDGHVHGVAVTLLDTSEGLRTRRMLDRIIEHAPNSIALKDLEGRYEVYNERGAATLGLRSKDIVGRSDAEVFGPELAQRLLAQDREVATRSTPLTFKDELRTADGVARSFLTTKFPLPGPDGTAEAIGLIASDVTELQRAERDRAQLAALVQAAPDAIIARDRDGRIATWNPGAEAIFGLAAQDAIGKPYVDLVVPGDQRDSHDALLEGAMSGRTLTARVERMRADGSRFPAQVSVAPLTLLDGTWHGTLAMVRDITDLYEAELELRRRAEALERANADLERSNADLERFAYSASHDLQEPLRSIKLSAGAVIAAAAERLDRDECELIAHIDQAAGRMSDQVRGLMEVAQVALGRGPSERVALLTAVRDAADAVRAAAEVAEAEIDVRHPLPDVDVPRTEVSLVLQNLIANAIKYRRDDVRPRIVVAGTMVEDQIEVSVSDNGVGLSEADLKTVFSLFGRVQTSVPGTGMGLAVARRMLERHGGTILAASEGRGHGSRFTIRLPVQTRSA
jgi:PAS domain S-box-containing protein